jgi:hypothetical protein
MARKSQRMLQDEVLSRIKKRVPSWFTYYSKNNDFYRRDTKFVYQEDYQWTTEEVREYKRDSRPRMTFNMLPRYITNLAAEFAENVPDVEVRSEHFQEVDQGIIDLTTNLLRNISLDSRNDLVYQTAAQNAWTGGYGAFRVTVERENPMSFNFVIRYKPIYDPTTCFWDPMAKMTDKSDGQYCGIAIPMAKSEFESKYPGIPVPKFTPLDEGNFVWATDEEVTVVDYWEKIPFKKQVSLLSDNTVMDADLAEDHIKQQNKEIRLQKEQFPAAPINLLSIVKTETRNDFKIMFYRTTKDDVLEKSEWDGRELPIIFVAGITKWVDGRERTYGLVHWMKDAQRAYNYARSEYLYRLQLTRYEKFLVTKENVAGNEDAWQNVHKAKSALVYKTGPLGEKPIVVPSQSVGNDLQAEMTRSLGDLQLIPGRFDPNFGGQGNEISGTAIATRQRGGNLNIKEYFDNVFSAVESGARVVVDLLPKIYDTERRVTINKPDGTQESTLVNTNTANTLKDTLFNVKINVGSSFAIQQSENVAKLIQLSQANPKLADLVSDIIVKNLDIQHGPQMVERIQRWAIPTIAASEGSKDPIVQQNAQKATQNPAAQIQQQAASLELQSKQLELQKQQQDMMIDKMGALDDRMKAMASQAQGQAALINADTGRTEAQIKGAVESQKIQAEEDRSRSQIQLEQLKLVREIEKERGIM